MRIKKIALKNLFSFHGKQEIYFEDKTVVLAENGLGKTSLLNSIKLALGQKRVQIDSILNSSATDKECFIEIDFDVFTLKRVWDFKENFESLTIYLNNTILKDYEAEEFLKEKFPLELVDFIFFDGEVEKDLILLKSRKIKRIFEYSFDLDILSNMTVDTKKVANRLSNQLGSDEITKFTNFQQKEVKLSQLIEDKRVLLNRDIRIVNELIRLNELKIRNRSKAVKSIQEKIDENRMNLSKEIEIFQEINLYQLPLLLNNALLKKVNKKDTKAIKILNQKEFEDKFTLFAESLNSSSEKNELLEKFYNIFNVNSGINLTFSKKDLISILKKLIDSIDTKERLQEQLDKIKERLAKKDNLKKLQLEGVELKKDKEKKELEFNYLCNKLDETNNQYKINDKFKVVLEDEKGSFLDMTLLSAGQKQILSFILISTILEFKKFVDFIFIDTPFGRLSNKSRDFIFNNYYLNFSYLTLLITSSEYDYLKKQNSHFKIYEIRKNKFGSIIYEVKNG